MSLVDITLDQGQLRAGQPAGAPAGVDWRLLHPRRHSPGGGHQGPAGTLRGRHTGRSDTTFLFLMIVTLHQSFANR